MTYSPTSRCPSDLDTVINLIGQKSTTMVRVYRLHTEVHVSMQFTLPRAAGLRWRKKRIDQTEVCNQLVLWLMML